MADDKTRAHGADRSRIDIHQDYELRDWSRKFGVTPEQLKQAVRAAGDRADAVERHLKGSGASADAGGQGDQTRK